VFVLQHLAKRAVVLEQIVGVEFAGPPGNFFGIRGVEVDQVVLAKASDESVVTVKTAELFFGPGAGTAVKKTPSFGHVRSSSSSNGTHEGSHY